MYFSGGTMYFPPKPILKCFSKAERRRPWLESHCERHDAGDPEFAFRNKGYYHSYVEVYLRRNP